MKYTFYMMEDNIYLGNCLAVVCSVSDDEESANNLTGNNIVIFIKFGKQNNFKNKRIDYFDIISSKNFKKSKPILLRISSECLFGMFGDSHCDCEKQRIASLEAINENGQGIYIQLPQEAQGRGLFYKAMELSLQVSGHNSNGEYVGEKSIIDACKYLLGEEDVDIRKFDFLKAIFKKLNLDKLEYVLISNSLRKANAMAEELNVNIIGNIEINKDISVHNVAGYLEKIYSKDYKLNDKDVVKIIHLINSHHKLPERAVEMIKRIEDSICKGIKLNSNTDLLHMLCKAGKKHYK